MDTLLAVFDPDADPVSGLAWVLRHLAPETVLYRIGAHPIVSAAAGVSADAFDLGELLRFMGWRAGISNAHAHLRTRLADRPPAPWIEPYRSVRVRVVFFQTAVPHELRLDQWRDRYRGQLEVLFGEPDALKTY